MCDLMKHKIPLEIIRVHSYYRLWRELSHLCIRKVRQLTALIKKHIYMN